MRILAKNAVPLVNDDDERTPRLHIDGFHHAPQLIAPQILIVRVCPQQIPEQRILHQGKKFRHALCLTQKFLHIEPQHIARTSAARKLLSARDRQSREHLVRDRMVIESADHVRRHRLAEAPRTAHADIFLLRAEHRGELEEHRRLVDVDFRPPRLEEQIGPRIQIDSHRSPLLYWIRETPRVPYLPLPPIRSYFAARSKKKRAEQKQRLPHTAAVSAPYDEENPCVRLTRSCRAGTRRGPCSWHPR